ncbi:hypothetical protein B0H15DRAFT_933823 [Mycena belliarum]|uniref:DUF7330 domain-containing protein n=1 Tax=Mycena belliarum TaxID=1033014 RepID=A0AAD6TUJ6_9AGAR|nr:hypothetical protein B0H15DRAFT_933823 [Mycena belliae]
MSIPDHADLKDVKQPDVVVNRAAVPDDPPPAYSTPPAQPKAESAPKSEAQPLESEAQPLAETSDALPQLRTFEVSADVKPTNLLSLSRRNGFVKGTYVIDPRVKIPQAMLPLLADEADGVRRDVFLHTSNGPIDADLFVFGKGRVEMHLKSTNGPVTGRIHAPDPARAPIRTSVQSSKGLITLHLPRTFRGPVTVCARNGSVKFSGALQTQVTTFAEGAKTRRCFIGVFADWAEGEAWAGDEVSIESEKGSVKLQYDDEPDGAKKGSFLGRIFGGIGIMPQQSFLPHACGNLVE